MEKAKKLTKKDYFKMLKEIDEIKKNDELIAFIDREIELLDKKSVNRKPSKAQEENEQIKDKIIKTLSKQPNLTITDLIKVMKLDMSNQKVSALMTQLKNEQKVVREMVGKKATFKIA